MHPDAGLQHHVAEKHVAEAAGGIGDALRIHEVSWGLRHGGCHRGPRVRNDHLAGHRRQRKDGDRRAGRFLRLAASREAGPGAMPLTRIRGASASAMVWVSVQSAAFDSV
jgi:hypothetical protein